jgi:hypothetical protein
LIEGSIDHFFSWIINCELRLIESDHIIFQRLAFFLAHRHQLPKGLLPLAPSQELSYEFPPEIIKHVMKLGGSFRNQSRAEPTKVSGKARHTIS